MNNAGYWGFLTRTLYHGWNEFTFSPQSFIAFIFRSGHAATEQYDDEVRTGNAMILDPYGEILVETGKADDDMVIADLDADTLATSSGRRWLQARRPELYEPLCVPTGKERDTRSVRFDG